jgi:hypothetical protein
MVRNYPARKAEHEELHSQSLVADTSGMPGGSNVSRTTENVAIREMAPAKQMEYEAVTQAIRITQMLPTGDKRIELIDRMYWKGRKLRIDDVVMHLYISDITGKRWHSEFIALVGSCYGYLE